jgi:hypothetical protein
MLCVAAAALVTSAAGCAMPKVLIDQGFLGATRTGKMIIQRSPEGQFNQILRICTLNKSGQETDCKDTLVLQNVIPASLY